MGLFHKINEGIYSYGGLYLLRKDPVIIYAAGRVGSMGLQKQLRKAGVFSFKVERCSAEGGGSAQFAATHILKKKIHAPIITLVRDPLEILISTFFSKIFFGHLTNAQQFLKQGNIHKLQECFIADMLNTKRLHDYLFWFEEECIPNTGIDVFSTPFDYLKKYSFIYNDTNPLLIMRTDLDDTAKEKCISEFLGANVKIHRDNTRSKKEGGDIYETFKSSLKIPNHLLKVIYSAPYSTLFLSAEEIEVLIKKRL